MKKKLLLHSCCGPCSSAVIERLSETNEYDITVFYFNPCITDNKEYERRKEAQIKLIKECNYSIEFMEGDYFPETFISKVKGHEKDPEGGERCLMCFEQRLSETAYIGKNRDYDCFGTTLTVSPHKSYKDISDIGRKLGNRYDIEFLDMDFKKKDGFKRSIELSRKYGLYRQNYCGCDFSKNNNSK